MSWAFWGPERIGFLAGDHRRDLCLSLITVGTVIWTLPDGQVYVTTPGSALLFPSLCTPAGDLPPPDPARADRCGERTAMMPLRTSTRAQNRARYIAAERHLNRQARQSVQVACAEANTASPPPDPDEPPPF